MRLPENCSKMIENKLRKSSQSLDYKYVTSLHMIKTLVLECHIL